MSDRWRASWLIGLSTALLVVLGSEVRGGPLVFDQPLADAIRGLGGTGPVRALNVIAGLPVWTAFVTIVAGVLFLRGYRRGTVLLLAGLSAELATAVVKTLVDRPRPVGAAASDLIASASFPSGHIVRAVVILGLLITVLGRNHRSWRLPLLAASTAFVSALAVARIASGEHWPSDVLGGLLLGAIWLQVLLLGLGARRPDRA